jgi:hypothetical protein
MVLHKSARLRRRPLHEMKVERRSWRYVNYKCGKAGKRKKKCRGASLRGQGSPGFILPASAVSEQENCGGDAKPPNFVLFRVCK